MPRVDDRRVLNGIFRRLRTWSAMGRRSGALWSTYDLRQLVVQGRSLGTSGLDPSMESTQVCIIDENGRKLRSGMVESTPDAIADALRHGSIELAMIETGRMSPAICLGLRELGVNVVCIDVRRARQNSRR